MPILDPERTYTFSQYFDLRFDAADILAELGATLERRYLTWPCDVPDNLVSVVAELRASLLAYLPKTSLNSKMARRELLISPILTRLLEHLPIQLSIEYVIDVSSHLKGSLDYLVRGQQTLIVIEAKQADLGHGMTQLAVELIALEQWLKDRGSSWSGTLFGAVTTGDIWQFSLYREHKIIQDLNSYRIPADLENVVGILSHILQGTNFIP